MIKNRIRLSWSCRLAVALLVGASCGGSQLSDPPPDSGRSVDGDAGGDRAGDGADAGAAVPRGAPGSHVWFDSSTSIQLENHWSFETLGPGSTGQPKSGSSSLALEKSALSADQLTALEGLVLVPLTSSCTADAYSYDELTVFDEDGSKAIYRDTGCSYLRAEGAQAMLPPDALSRELFPRGTGLP